MQAAKPVITNTILHEKVTLMKVNMRFNSCALREICIKKNARVKYLECHRLVNWIEIYYMANYVDLCNEFIKIET